MKIAIYCHSIAPSIDGVCRRFTSILNELINEGHEVLLFTLEEDPQDIPLTISTVWLDYLLMPAYPNKRVAKPELLTLYTIFTQIQQFQPDYIHVTGDGVSQLFALVGLLLNIPTVGSFHTDILDLLSSHNANFFQLFSLQFKESVDSFILDSCATTSASFARKLRSQGLNTEHIIITGVNTSIFTPKKKNLTLRNELTFGNPDGFLCVYVGRISKEKRMEVMLEAVKSIPNAYLAIIGDGPTAHLYGAMHGVENRVYCKPRFLDHEELAEIYASSDVHVSASEFETLGNTVLEAFASEIPVVVPRTQGFCDTVSHEVNGFLFEPGDPNSAKSYLVRLKENPHLRHAMGVSGRESVQDKGVTRVVQDLLGWYQQGKRNRLERGSVGVLARLFVLLFTIPFAIVAIAGYELVVSLLGIAPKKQVKMKNKTN